MLGEAKNKGGGSVMVQFSNRANRIGGRDNTAQYLGKNTKIYEFWV